MLEERHALPEGTDVKKLLQFYTQTCATETAASKLSVLAATFANGGQCPLTNEKVFKEPDTVKNCLSQMLSCGMNNYSGEWAFSVGLPAKSSVSGAIIMIVPNICGICVWSPLLDNHFNSKKGLAFLHSFVDKFHYNNVESIYGRKSGGPLPNLSENIMAPKAFELIFYASTGNLKEIRRLVALGKDINAPDYDRRTALHLACAEGHLDAVKYLVVHGARKDIKDRFGNDAVAEAERCGHNEILEFLKSK